ncbi:Flp family type IVb pilin [Cryobacterium tagatosivorans]|uniref:Flp family type IVb pilin n=1 Tax=Cryobacterium tagatosivorans TaxID=1259199 RepID=A0A4R8UEN3_9MICO|nr:Flp family type IVb pilin [Cryobacterium tagatosivorans]TFB48963.1 Flp family type IVb pilin [Cryobacterium tagatosivorans]
MRTILDIPSTRLRHADDLERGATAVEYALMSSLIAVIILGAVGAVGGGVLGMFNAVVLNWP